MTIAVDPSVTEQSEAEAWFQFQKYVPDATRAALGMGSARIGDAVALSMSNDVTRFWSKSLGFKTAVTADVIREICDFYRSADAPQATFQIAPAFLPEDWKEICQKEDLTPQSLWVKLVCPVQDAVARLDTLQSPASGIRITPVRPEQAKEWGRTMYRSYGMPLEHYSEMGPGTVGLPGWHPFAAWLDDELVGTGTVFVQGETAQMFAGGVLPHARQRGAQTALLAARVRLAQELGCRLLIAETGAEGPGEHNPSLHNMFRLGFQVAYERRNWAWVR
ncbi:GNAT family N-acetyltransferase [Actinacidiphila glaucinigra]|uniref:GNAT family N-acetyltransferase n=1 Tax=Actinacidiphila glaucinigra TaxID=235986 RepID=UPI0037C533CD